MATVTRKFRDDFELWAAHQIEAGGFTPVEMADFKDMLRRDLAPGPDQLREGLKVIIASGVEIPASIDDHQERYRMWADYFAGEVEAIRLQSPSGARTGAGG